MASLDKAVQLRRAESQIVATSTERLRDLLATRKPDSIGSLLIRKILKEREEASRCGH